MNIFQNRTPNPQSVMLVSFTELKNIFRILCGRRVRIAVRFGIHTYLYPRGRRYTPRSGGLPHTTSNGYNGLMSTPVPIYKLRADQFMLMISTPDYPQVSGEERQINI